MKKAIFLCNTPSSIVRVYDEDALAQIRRLYDLGEQIYTEQDLSSACFLDVEAIFSTWGMPSLTAEQIAVSFPALKYVFYAAGTVQSFARPFLQNGVRVFSAWKANAVPVAEFTLAQILLANKGYYQMIRKTAANYRTAQQDFAQYIGNYGAKVGILGDGAIGSLVIDALQRHQLEIMVYSITMTQEEAEKKGVRLGSLEEIFSECDVISNHLANNAATQKMLNRQLFARMKPNATLINTGRGAQIDEEALVEILEANPSMTALLDVTDPEPPLKDSPLCRLNNVFLTPHIAGSAGQEVHRMAAYMADTCQAVLSGLPSANEVLWQMLEAMA